MAIIKSYTTNQGATGDYWSIDKDSVSQGLDLVNQIVSFETHLFVNEDGKKVSGYNPLVIGDLTLEDTDFPLSTLADGETRTDILEIFMVYLYNKVHEAAATGTLSLRSGNGTLDIHDGYPHLGAWVSQNYVVNDIVTYTGNTYQCILDTVSNEDPTNTTYWVQI
jgi:hypothetical protein